jgi:hypothetical protein
VELRVASENNNNKRAILRFLTDLRLFTPLVCPWTYQLLHAWRRMKMLNRLKYRHGWVSWHISKPL